MVCVFNKKALLIKIFVNFKIILVKTKVLQIYFIHTLLDPNYQFNIERKYEKKDKGPRATITKGTDSAFYNIVTYLS